MEIFPPTESINANVCECFTIYRGNFFFGEFKDWNLNFFLKKKGVNIALIYVLNYPYISKLLFMGRNEIGKNLKFVVLFGFSKNSLIDNISTGVKYASVI